LFDSGCFTDKEPSFFKNAKVGAYYNFGKEVSLEIRSKEDPYMVFAYTRDNLGTDFTMFLYFAIFCFIATIICTVILVYFLVQIKA
jgi:hypothetical protein